MGILLVDRCRGGVGGHRGDYGPAKGTVAWLLLLLTLLGLAAAACGQEAGGDPSTSSGVQVLASPAPRALPPSSVPSVAPLVPAGPAMAAPSPSPAGRVPAPAGVGAGPTAVIVGGVVTLSAQELKALLDGPSRPPVFDVRPRAVYDSGHIPGALCMPWEDLEKRTAEVPKDRLSVFYCGGST